MCSLTERQREVLEFIARFSEDNAYPPTVREIGEHFSVSLRAVQDHIAALQKKGYISLCPKRSRSIRVLKDCRTDGGSLSTVRVPVLKASFCRAAASERREHCLLYRCCGVRCPGRCRLFCPAGAG